jgi:hypothetical protein
MKLPGIRGIDSYKIIRKNFDVPGRLLIYHRDSLENRKKLAASPDGIAIVRDRQTTFGMADSFYSSVFHQHTRAFYDTVSNQGRGDSYFGCWLGSLVGKLGFNETAYEGYVPINHGGDSTSISAAITFEVIAKSLISKGLFTQEQCDKILQLYRIRLSITLEQRCFPLGEESPVKSN